MKILAMILATCLLTACSSIRAPTVSPSTGATADANVDFLYGRHAGQPMRDAPDSY